MNTINTAAFPAQVGIFEVGPRDGLQPEPVFIDTRKKIEYVDMLTDAGCKKIEVTSFVHPKWVPQLADAKEVFAGIRRKEGVVYSALVPNLRGLEIAAECGIEEVVTIVSTSESHNKKNLNVTPAETLKEIEKINAEAKRRGMRVRSYIATVFGCPIEGDQDIAKALDIALALESFGAYEISLGDTTGMANPVSAYAVPKMIKEKLSRANLAVHYHQHFGLEFANNFASLQAGITTFDGAAGGLGGCPYAPGATGNCATEILSEMFLRMGIQTGIDSEKIRKTAEYAKTLSTLIHGNCKI
ncbi:MAG: hydroxymethylglutaryl-CoA lyase [Spirochaetales bacterium]|jgi:hydroxymethylglutaryl-CoA lyase|nr:hydroxymethylglutaryl-CoA lyase [Spirochaetales bacterium]